MMERGPSLSTTLYFKAKPQILINDHFKEKRKGKTKSTMLLLHKQLYLHSENTKGKSEKTESRVQKKATINKRSPSGELSSSMLTAQSPRTEWAFYPLSLGAFNTHSQVVNYQTLSNHEDLSNKTTDSIKRNLIYYKTGLSFFHHL